MAEAAMNHVLSKLSDALLEKAQELYKVRGQIEQMQMELRLIQGLLRDADSKSNRDEAVREWLKLVREMAYPNCSKLTTVVKNPKKMNKLSGELNKITQELQLIYQRKTDLGITVLDAGSEENVRLPSEQPFRPTKPSDIDESEVVGLEAATSKIIKQLLDENELRCTVLSIVGIGGLGKTTLAQNGYKRISTKHVTKMWVAEEFIPKDGSGTIEDRAERFLQELVQRCLIQVTEYSWNGCCKYCSIHDFLRELAIHKAKEDNFFTIFSKAEIN